MKKFIKTLTILAIVTLCTVCLAAFAGCGDNNKDDNKLDPDTIYITVLDESGKAIDGTTFGKWALDESVTQVSIQFCAVDGNGACTMTTPDVGTDGKAQFKLSELKSFAESNNATTVELHVLYVDGKDYKKEYGQYKVSEIPQTITVTLKKADA